MARRARGKRTEKIKKERDKISEKYRHTKKGEAKTVHPNS